MNQSGFVAISSTHVATGIYLRGGILKAPEFQLESGSFSPLHAAPWINSPNEAVDGLLGNLQGDFFCCPFGANDTPFEEVQHPLHGFCCHEDWEILTAETAGSKLKFSKDGLTILKEVWLGSDHPALYQRHTLTGRGKVSYGHHVMLQTLDKSVRWWTSPFHHGQVFPGVFEGPETEGRQALAPGGKFTRLDWVPGERRCYDISRRPHAPGHEDLCQIFDDPARKVAWHVALFPGSPDRLWVSVKAVETLPSTVIWMSEGGRDAAPWNGRHKGVLALEDTCSHFHFGLAESAAAHRPDRPTCGDLDAGPIVTRTGMTCLEVPFKFSQIEDVEVHRDHLVVRTDTGDSAVKFHGELVL